MAYTWTQWKALVRKRLSDRKPDVTNFAAAVTEYVLARQAQMAGDKDGYALHQNRYTSLRKGLMGYETAHTAEQLKAAVKDLLRDAGASDTMFNEAVAAYVRAQMNTADSANAGRFLSLRTRLAGYQMAQNDATLQSKVRELISDAPRTNVAFAQACAYFVRSEISREVDSRGDDSATAMQIAETYRKEFERMRIQLAGFNHTLGGGLQTEVDKHLPVDAIRKNVATYRQTLTAAAVERIQSLGTWIDAQIATAKYELQSYNTWIDQHVLAAQNDLQALSERVDTEIRAAVIDLQQYIRAYTVGHSSTVTQDDVTDMGNASLGTLPDGAMLRTARIDYEDVTEEVEKVDRPCEAVAWEDRVSVMIRSDDTSARIAIDPRGIEYLVSPRLQFPRPQLLITYDGTKLEFEDGDTVPFDEDAALAAAKWVNAELAAEWGEPAVQQQIWRGGYVSERTRIYLKNRRRSEVSA
jgi:hypothetical protein